MEKTNWREGLKVGDKAIMRFVSTTGEKRVIVRITRVLQHYLDVGTMRFRKRDGKVADDLSFELEEATPEQLALLDAAGGEDAS